MYLLNLDDYNVHNPRKFLINVESTYRSLLASEDTDGNFQITIEDGGPKVQVFFCVSTDI